MFRSPVNIIPFGFVVVFVTLGDVLSPLLVHFLGHLAGRGIFLELLVVSMTMTGSVSNFMGVPHRGPRRGSDVTGLEFVTSLGSISQVSNR